MKVVVQTMKEMEQDHVIPPPTEGFTRKDNYCPGLHWQGGRRETQVKQKSEHNKQLYEK